MYNRQYKNWANFTYNPQSIQDITDDFTSKLHIMDSILNGLSFSERQEEQVRFMTTEAEKTAKIEGECISRVELLNLRHMLYRSVLLIKKQVVSFCGSKSVVTQKSVCPFDSFDY